jgi:hypothetical protein
LLGIFYGSEDGDDMFLQNFGFPLKYTALQPTRPDTGSMEGLFDGENTFLRNVGKLSRD